MNELNPSAEIRNFKVADIVGKTVVIHLRHISENSQYVCGSVTSRGGLEVNFSGWADKILGAENAQIKRKIVDAALVVHANGGRSSGEWKSYWEFFNDERKAIVRSQRAAGIMGQLLSPHRGDQDQADIIVRFKDFEVDSFWFGCDAPEEWYSEQHASEPKFRFVDGFYADANAAIDAFERKSHDDLFGERYFPVVVFPRDQVEIAKDVAAYAKSCTECILTERHVIIGTRCKPDEFRYVIENTYKLGGQIPIGVEWDW